MEKTIEERFEEAVDDFASACADVASCYEWGVGSSSAERYKQEARQKVFDIFNEIRTANEKKD